jgi:hypothetical protein
MEKRKGFMDFSSRGQSFRCLYPHPFKYHRDEKFSFSAGFTLIMFLDMVFFLSVFGDACGVGNLVVMHDEAFFLSCMAEVSRLGRVRRRSLPADLRPLTLGVLVHVDFWPSVLAY